VVVFIVIGKAIGGILLAGFAMMAWSLFARPVYQRRAHDALSNLPKWEIEPD
jgi:hypothetical protein